ncbi:hypothetical protein AUC31_12125 [Planococcus rifietoensis]|uniref:Uncharacterized protein n=1 Tax=Planococcus rifietoensis TaxID=200991 RepID=A0A0U2PCI9_9BACL|nr:hypothetical protein [Planococcus rifietoensis]ALS75895.1 hypothetical protein AUC31_12125 [Planococcus rifietoensis]
MKDRIILVIVLASVLGSSAVSASSLSQTIKSGYHAAAASILLAVGISSFYTYMKKRKAEKVG